MANKKDDDKILASYSSMSEAIRFFLQESFRHIENQIRYCIASEMYGAKLKLIDITEEDKVVSSDFTAKVKDNLDLIYNHEDPLTRATLKRLSDAWADAQREAEFIDMKFKPSMELASTDLLGHITNFAFVVEILFNRHLFILNLHDEINSFEFNILDKASVANKMIFVFKEEISNKKFNPEKIAYLFKLRNFAVHFTRDNSEKFKATIHELIEIWRETSNLMSIMHSKEKIDDNDFKEMLDYYREEFIKRFVLKKGNSNI
jgi:hypothetical protein